MISTLGESRRNTDQRQTRWEKLSNTYATERIAMRGLHVRSQVELASNMR